LVKSTVLIAIPLLFITLLYVFTKNRSPLYCWLIFSLAGIFLIRLTTSLDDLAYWQRSTNHNAATRQLQENAPLGEYVIEISNFPDSTGTSLSQLIPGEKIQLLQGDDVTLGSWIWASKPLKIKSPIFDDGKTAFSTEITVGLKPSFYSFPIHFAENTPSIEIRLDPFEIPVEEDVKVYYDGLILVSGTRTSDSSPLFETSNGENGLWGNEPFENMINNGSGETLRLQLNPKVETFIKKYFHINPQLSQGLFYDWDKTKIYFNLATQNLFRTYWAKFGWGNVNLIGVKPYRIILLITLIGILGSISAIWRMKVKTEWIWIVIFGTALTIVWGAAYLRGISSTENTNAALFIPSARYVYPVVIPSMLILLLGWIEIRRLAKKPVPIFYKSVSPLLVAFFVILDIFAIVSIYQYYF
jgi:hypothetical protein